MGWGGKIKRSSCKYKNLPLQWQEIAGGECRWPVVPGAPAAEVSLHHFFPGKPSETLLLKGTILGRDPRFHPLASQLNEDVKAYSL